MLAARSCRFASEPAPLSARGSPDPQAPSDDLNKLPILYFSMRLIRAGAWNAYLPVLLPGPLPHLGRGHAALVNGRDQVPVRHGRRGGAFSEPVPPDPGAARRPFLLSIDAWGLP
jgi:hypothetical protein